jgi:hypothetical protein
MNLAAKRRESWRGDELVGHMFEDSIGGIEKWVAVSQPVKPHLRGLMIVE